MAAASYEWAVSVDGEDWTVVETETDETFAVTADLVGMYVKVTVTAEDEETASDVTVLPVEEADGQIEILSAEAVKTNEILVTLAEPIDAENTTIEVYKGTDAITVEADWADTNDSVILTTAANMSTGIYTVTLTSEEDETNTDTESFEVTGRYVNEIVILNDVALTAPTGVGIANPKRIAYAYYDVYDQYGESMRASASITWSGSCTVNANKSTGRLTLTKTAAQDWIYNEQIFVTGVYAKTGITAQKTLTVGTEQSLDTIVMKGFVKKGTTDILTSLPAGFKDEEYYMIFNVLDQNGNELVAGTANTNNVTFVSDNVLVVKELTNFAPNPITVKGDEYDAVFVTPGIRVSDGGEVTVTAIANKTGNKTDLNFVVGEDPVVASFTISAPSATIADGDSVEIPFEALDENGNPIRNFVTLAKQETFNTISFNASEGTLKLAQQNDGTAKLKWTDKTMLWTNSQTTDGIDRPVSLTVVVVGGGTDNEMISVSDKRRPDAIADVKTDKVFTEGATVTFNNTHTDSAGEFKFYDQYGQVIGTTWGDDNGFFAADVADQLSGTDFADHHFGIRVINAGSGKMTWAGPRVAGVYVDATGKNTVLEDVKSINFSTATDIESVATGEGFKFEIVSIKDTDLARDDSADKWDSVSTAKYFPMSVVDIAQVKDFAISDLGTVYVGELDKTGDGVYGTPANLKSDTEKFSTITTAPTTDQQKEIVVKGKYNGESVTVPVTYLDYEANKLDTATAGGKTKITTPVLYAGTDPVNDHGLKPADLYDKTTATGVSKLGEDSIKAKIKKIYSNTTTWTTKTTSAITYKSVAAYDKTTWNATTTDETAIAALITTVNVAANTAKTPTALAAEITNANTKLATLRSDVSSTLTTHKDDALAEIPTDNDVDAKVADASIERVIDTPDNTLVDTATTTVKLSDQKPYAAKIVNLQEAYTLSPSYTFFETNAAQVVPTSATTTKNVNLATELIALINAANADAGIKPVKFVDQYGFDLKFAADATPTAATFRITDVAESPEGYAENNFKVTGNDTHGAYVEGAELGDTFSLVVSLGGVNGTTAVTVGADAQANIEGQTNNYLKELKPVLEVQRLAGLN